MIQHSPPLLIVDVAAMATLLGTVAGALPSAVALFAALYYIFAITDIIRKWKHRD